MPESGPLALTIDLRKERNLRESKILFKSAVVNNVEISPPGEGTRIRSTSVLLSSLYLSQRIYSEEGARAVCKNRFSFEEGCRYRHGRRLWRRRRRPLPRRPRCRRRLIPL